jgi:hypothetical protein
MAPTGRLITTEFRALRDLCRVRGSPETLKTLTEKKPVVIVGGKNAECFGFFSKTLTYTRTAGTEHILFEGVELSLDAVLRQCPARQRFFTGA